MKKSMMLITLLLMVVASMGCGGKGDGQQGNGTGDNTNADGGGDGSLDGVKVWEKGGLKVYPLQSSPEFPNATLTVKEPPAGVDLASGTNRFSFEVNGFDLGTPTADAASKGIANSDHGQHLHFLLNNGPYGAQYTPEFQQDLQDGHYVMLAFLSRSYHESVKSPKAFAIRQFVVGQPGNFKQLDLKAPHLFFSRPKGVYKGDDTKRLLLDFYLINCTLSADGFKVRATINGNEFTITKWAPYVIEGLPMGEVSIKLELLDQDGQLVDSPFNPVERSATLEGGS